MTLIQFDDRYEVNYKSMPIAEVAELIEKETYITRGSTALYDAIGKTINELQTDRDVIFVIITDGYENASREFRGEAIKKMIETLETENKWKFVYLGANQDAIAMGGNIGIKSGQSMTWAATDGGVENTFYAMSANLKSYRSAKASYDSYVAENVDKAIDYSEYLAENLDKLNFSEQQRKESMDEKDGK
jgi:5S rRNA maturation endonuclease (ribonuclease M5)